MNKAARTGLRNAILGLVSAACLGFTAFVAYSLIYNPDFMRVPIGGAFEMTGLAGEPVSDSDFRGRYLLLYFGYTYCPDLCPTALSDMTIALGELEARSPRRAEKVVPVFVTLDPERDTRAQLRAYMPHFHPRFVTLTGTDAQTDAMARAYNVTYRRVPLEGSADYLLDHTAYVFLMGPDGRYLTHFTPKENAAAISQRLAELIE